MITTYRVSRNDPIQHGFSSFYGSCDGCTVTAHFDDFATARIDVGEAELFVRYGGAGPPLLLLHGYPETHRMWRPVADLLAERFTLIAPDLRGYGRSSKPADSPDHEAHSKRAMARDMVRLMHYLGHNEFDVAGHDRGAVLHTEWHSITLQPSND